MNISFDNIAEHIIPMADCSLKWRFIDDNYNTLPAQHLEQLKPLNKYAAKYLWDFITKTRLHSNTPFKKDFFRTIDKIKIKHDNAQEIKKWLYHRGFPFDKPVFLSWQPTTAMIVPWKLLIKYYDDFYYGGADDLTIIDETLNWALLFYHEDEIYFGSNIGYELEQPLDDMDFIW